MWETIRNLVREKNITIFLTTQYLEEADRLADHAAVLDQGQIVAEGTVQELKARVHGGHIVLTFATPEALDAGARTLGEAATRDGEDLTLQVPGDGSAHSVQTVLNKIDSRTITHLSLRTPDLDDVFIALTGHNSQRGN